MIRTPHDELCIALASLTYIAGAVLAMAAALLLPTITCALMRGCP